MFERIHEECGTPGEYPVSSMSVAFSVDDASSALSAARQNPLSDDLNTAASRVRILSSRTRVFIPCSCFTGVYPINIPNEQGKNKFEQPIYLRR